MERPPFTQIIRQNNVDCLRVYPWLVNTNMASSFLLCCVTVLALQAASALATPTGTRCPTAPKRYTETCVCDAPDGIIDMTTLANDDGTPRLVNSTTKISVSCSYTLKRYNIFVLSPVVVNIMAI